MKLNKPLFFIIFLGIVLRLYKITEKSLWFDELGEYYASSQSFINLITVVQSHLSPPLDYIILWIALKITPHTDFYIRFPSLMWGILSIPAIYLLSKKLTENNNIALLSSFFLATSPLAVQYSQEARPYSLFLFLTIISFYFLIQIEKSHKYYILWILSGILLIYTHYFSVFVLILQFLYIIWKNPCEHLFSSYVLKIFDGLLIIVLSFLPWLPSFLYQLQSGLNSGLIQQTFYSEHNFIFLLPLFLIFAVVIILKLHDIAKKPNKDFDITFIVLISALIILYQANLLSQYYSLQKEDWKGAGQYLDNNAKDNDSIIVVGGIPKFLQHYTQKNLNYQSQINYNSAWFLVSSWSGQFGLNQSVNRTQIISNLTNSKYQKVEFYQFTLYKSLS